MKLLSAACYGTDKDIFEREILLHLRDADSTHPGHEHITQLVDTFEHTGPDGQHVCLVFEVIGESLRSFGTWFKYHRLPNSIMRRFTIHLLLALDYAILSASFKPVSRSPPLLSQACLSALSTLVLRFSWCFRPICTDALLASSCACAQKSSLTTILV
jgi:hypothetical protein